MLNTRLNRLITLTLLFTPGVYSYAQTKYEVSGQVFDEMNEPMPFVNVGFFTPDDDVPIGGRASAIDGTFSYELEGGVYKIKVSFIGYKTFYLDSLQVNENLELPFIYLKPDAQELENVVIVSERPTVQIAPGVKTYNISENAVSESSTALDILRNLPSTQVDADDEITLRGRKVTILVDGVEMDMENILEQIPADRIESIDVMSNPSAKYDTQNGEGVLNIRLRKNKKTGYSTYAGLGIGNSGRYNPSFGGSHTKGKLSINGGGQVIWNVNKDRSSNYRTSFRVVDTLNEGGSQTFVREAASFQDQKYRTTDDQLKYNYRLKSRYQLDDRNNLEISMAGGINDFARDRTYEQDFFNKDKEVTRTLNRKMEGDYITHWWNTSSRYHWKKNEGHEFIATINFHKNDRQDHHTFLDSLFRSSGEFNRVNRFDSISDGNLDKKLRMKVDYESPIANGHSIEVGGVATVRSVVRDYQYRNVDRADFTTWMLDSARSNVYDYDDRNYGVYGLVKGPAIFSDRLTYATGLRFNTAYLSPKSRTDTQSNDSKHVFWSPSFQLSYVINDVQSMSFNYSGKTKLPPHQRLNPFITYYGPTRLFFGNAQLKPERIQTYDFSYDVSLLEDKLFVNASAYYKNISNVSIRFRFDSEDEEGNNVVNQTFRNVENGKAYGFELIETWKVIEFMKLKSSFNMYTTTFNLFSTLYNEIIQREGTNYNLKTSADYQVNKKLSTQLSFNYFGTRVTAQGYDEPNYFMDLSARQKMLKENRLSLSFRMTDVLRTWNRNRVIDQEDTYAAVNDYSRNSFRYTVSARYSLNKMKFE